MLGFILMPRVDWRSMMFWSALCATLANALTGFAGGYLALCLLRFVAGFSVVLLTTVSACILARAAVPDRAFGAGMALSMVLSAAAIWILDLLRTHVGYQASLSSGALWLGVGVFLTLLLPKGLRSGRRNADPAAGNERGSGTVAIGRAALVSLLLFAVGANVVSGFTERVGLENGLASSDVARASATSYVIATAAIPRCRPVMRETRTSRLPSAIPTLGY